MKVGDLLKITKDIWDDGCENHHPPGYLATRGEIVIVRAVKAGRVYVSHRHITIGTFSVESDEYELQPQLAETP